MFLSYHKVLSFWSIIIAVLVQPWIVIIRSSSVIPLASAYSTGAGGCNGGIPAVQDQHLTLSLVKNGSLAEGNISITLDGEELSPSNTSLTFSTVAYHTLTLQRQLGYRGLLIRLGGVGENALRLTDSNLQVSTVCTELSVSGITHTGSALKNKSSALLRVDTNASSLPLDVTVVISNSNGQSEFYYSSFVLNAVEAPASPSAPSTPSQPSTTRPSTPTAPVTTPVAPSTKAPSSCAVDRTSWMAATTLTSLVVTLIVIILTTFHL